MADPSSRTAAIAAPNNKVKKDIYVKEELKIAVKITLDQFRYDEEKKEMEFPSSFTSTERAYIHRLAQSYGLITKSKGCGSKRHLTVKKSNGERVGSFSELQISPESCKHVEQLHQRFPLTTKERQDLQPKTERLQTSQTESGKPGRDNKYNGGKLTSGSPVVPPQPHSNEYSEFRSSLPIADMKENIVKEIEQNRVLMISGDTGSGKTTQVPQFIMEDCQSRSVPCRIICTQPRRISAISVAERVAVERGEKCGQAVGYQIRLESRSSPKTVLTYCTNGILLRTMITGDSNLSSITHVIVDEIHERDRVSDFLLISLRDLLAVNKTIKLILMSAALDINLFTKYFNSCPVLNVPGRCFAVSTFFLEDALKFTGYQNKKMSILKQSSQLDEKKSSDKEKRVRIQEPEEKIILDAQEKDMENENGSQKSTKSCNGSVDELKMADLEIADASNCTEEENPDNTELNEEDLDVTHEMDTAISDAFLTGNEDSYAQILHLIMNEGISVDYQHSETNATSLMVCAGRGSLDIVEQLLNLGASPHIREPKNNWDAADWARNWNHGAVAEFIESYVSQKPNHNDDAVLEQQSTELNNESKELLSLYHKTFDDDKVDLDLIFNLLNYICSSGVQGAVLTFLPGYDDIITLRDRLSSSKEFGNTRIFHICCLHSSMQPVEQRKAFRKMAEGTRKIILATNIAETSVTIDDVVYVIDCAKVKEKSFDALTSVSALETVWISKASAVQRKGRAGRCAPGVCYHLCSRVRYESFQEYQVPELLRYPLQELCLHTKLLAGPTTSISEFLSRAPEPPPYLVLRNAVEALKSMDAIDQWEDLTDLGRLLPDLPVEPRLGKIILFSIILKCLDPVIVLSTAMAYKDPFVIPINASEKHALARLRKRLAGQSYSDQLVVLKAFRGWQKAHSEGWDKNYCKKNFLFPGTMEMMAGMRSLILGQLKSMGFIRQRGSSDMRDLNTNSGNWAVVKAALCAGLYPNIVYIDKTSNKLMTQKEKKVRLHFSSSLFDGNVGAHRDSKMSESHVNTVKKLPSEWMIFEEMSRAAFFVHVKSCSVVSPITAALFCGPCLSSEDVESRAESGTRPFGYENVLSESSDSDSEGTDNEEKKKNTVLYKVHEFVQFHEKPEIVTLAKYLRHKLQALVVRRLKSPSRPLSQVDETVLRTIVHVMTVQEEALGINQQFQRTQRTWKPGSIVGRNDHKQHGQDDHTAEQSGRDERGRGKGGGGGAMRERKRHELPSRNFETDSSNTQEDVTSSKNRHYKYEVRYFIMKCNNQRNLEISMSKGIWATTQANEKKLNKAFKESRKVMLIFSVQGSGHFQGFAQMTSSISREKCREFGSNLLTGSFNVTWMKCVNIPFQLAHHLVNPWNDNKKVQISRDGQEVEPSIGEALCNIWSTDQVEKRHVFNHSQQQPSPLPHQQERSPYNENYRTPEQQPQMALSPAAPQWQNMTTSVPPYPQTPILFTTHPASMPIPVPITGAHQHTMMIPQQAYGQQMTQAPLAYAHQPMTLRAGYPPATQMTMEPQAQQGMGVVHVMAPEEYMGMQPQ